MNTILALAAHPDDIEFACGGSIAKWIDEGKKVWYVALSPCVKSLPEGSPPDRLFQELSESSKELGIEPEKVLTFDFEVRNFPQTRQALLERFILLREDIKPDLVLIPHSTDVHQDHHQVYLEGIRAFKNCSILGYELPWNNLGFENDFYVQILEKHMEAKLRSIKGYKSQEGRFYSEPARIRSAATYRGMQIGKELAECFQVVRWIS